MKCEICEEALFVFSLIICYVGTFVWGRKLLFDWFLVFCVGVIEVLFGFLFLGFFFLVFFFFFFPPPSLPFSSTSKIFKVYDV